MKGSLPTAISTRTRFACLNVVIAALILGSSVLSYGQEEQPSAMQVPHVLRRHVIQPATALPAPGQQRVKPELRVATEANATKVATGIGVVYTCASNVAASTCNYLNTVVAGYYNDLFTNANANIYVQYGTTGLGASLGYINLVSYKPYVTALTNIANKSSLQTLALSAINTYATPIYGTQNTMEVTVALGSALNFTGLTGITPAKAACTPYTAGCYNELVTVADAASQAAGGFTLYYDDQGGAEGANQYDFYAVVQHETDEVLGTSSCISTQSSSLKDECDFAGGTGVPSAVDLSRYDSPGVLANDTSPSTTAGQYFSFDGGAHYGAVGPAASNSQKVYNTLDNGDDFADYISSSPDCGTNEAVQDAEGCPGEDKGLTVLNDGQSELTILNVVGYKIPQAVITSPTPGSTLSGTSATFTWSAVSGASAYWVYVGSTGVGSANIFDNTSSITATSQAVTGIPTTGTVYVRIYSYVGGFWTSTDYTYKGGNSGTPTITLTPSSVTFPGSTLVNTTDATAEPVTVKNTSTVSANLTKFGISGTNLGSFSIYSNTCGTTLAASATCTITLHFKPLVVGTNSATLTVTDNAGTGSQSASISGTGASAAPVLSFSATSLKFTQGFVGAIPAPAQALTITNTGNAAATISSIKLGGSDPSQYKSLTTCGTSLAASAQCLVFVGFKPTVTGTLPASLIVTDNAAGSPQTITLSGTGYAIPTLTLSTTSVTFPTTTHLTTSTATKIVLTNSSAASVNISSVAITGTNPTSFTQLNTCAPVLAASSSCSVLVSFTPQTTGALSAKLSFTDNAASSPQSVTLSGTGN